MYIYIDYINLAERNGHWIHITDGGLKTIGLIVYTQLIRLFSSHHQSRPCHIHLAFRNVYPMSGPFTEMG